LCIMKFAESGVTDRARSSIKFKIRFFFTNYLSKGGIVLERHPNAQKRNERSSINYGLL
jgi:hypothetical protein